MKKGHQINKVEIFDGHISAITSDGMTIKLTRQERKVLGHYRTSNYEEQIKRIFSNPDILTESFTVIDNGIVKFVHTRYE